MRGYLKKIPKELEEAACVDGASRLSTLRRLVLFAITINQVCEYQPQATGLFEFIGYQSVEWNQMMAAALTGIVPVVVVFLFLQKYLVAGLSAGAVKE